MGNKQSTIQKVYEAARDGSSDLTNHLKRLNSEERKTALDSKTKDGDENTTPLIIASRNGNLDSVKILLSFKADVEERGTVKVNTDEAVEGCSPLWAAAATGHLDVVKLLIDHNADVNGRNATNSTPLRAAAYDGRLDIVSCLAKNGADVNARDEFESTPLMITCYNGHMDVASYLIEHGANHHLQDKTGDTCLHYAAEKGHTEVVGRLLSLGVKERQNKKRLTPLLAASNESKYEMVEYYINRPECTKEQKINALELLGSSIANDPDSYDIEEAFSCMRRAMEERYQDPSCPLLKKNIKPVEDYENRTESQTLEELSLLKDDNHAIHMEGLMIKERLLGIDSAALLKDIRSYGTVLADSEHYEPCIGLYKRSMEIAMNCDEPITYELQMLPWLFILTALEQRCSNGKHIKAVFKKLTEKLETGKLQEGKENEENEKMLYCFLNLLLIYTKFEVLEDNEDEMEEIINYVQRILRLDIRNRDGNTLLHLAAFDAKSTGIVCKPPCVKTTKLILHAGFDVNTVNFEGETPLHLAVTFTPGDKQVETLKQILEILLDIGADTKLVNNKGQTPLECCESDVARRILSETRAVGAMDVVTRDVRKF